MSILHFLRKQILPQSNENKSLSRVDWKNFPAAVGIRREMGISFEKTKFYRQPNQQE